MSLKNSFAGPVKIPVSTIKSSSPKGKPVLYLLTIGVNKYTDSFWHDLNWAARDARVLSQALSKSSIRNVEPIILTNRKASLSRIKRVFRDLRSKVRPQDVVIVYLSGHGTLERNEDGQLEQYFVLSETKKQNIHKTGLRQNWIRAALDEIAARKKLLMIASCHSGVGKSKLSPKIKKILRSRKGAASLLNQVSEGSFIFAAASKWETAQEDKKLQGDIYTYFFIEGLKHGDRNLDGVVTAMEAHDFATRKTYKYTKGSQRPTVEAKFVGEDDIPLVGQKKNKGLPIIEAYHDAFKGVSMRVGKGGGRSLPSALPLKVGANEIRLYKNNQDKPYARFRLNVSEGETVKLEDIFDSPYFSIGLNLSLTPYIDRAYKKLIGDDIGLAQRFNLGLHKKRWLGGINYINRKADDESLDNGISSSFQRSHLSLYMGYSLIWNPKVSSSILFFFGQEQAKVSLKDLSQGEDWQGESRPTVYGFLWNLQLPFKSVEKLFFNISLGMYKTQFDFGYLGKLNGDFRVIEFGLKYHLWEKVTVLQ